MMMGTIPVPWRDEMNIMRALVVVGVSMVATAAAQAASTGLSINEDHKVSVCKAGCRLALVNPLAQH